MMVMCLVGFQCLPDVVKRRIWVAMVSCMVSGLMGGGVDILAEGARGWWSADCVAASCWASIRQIAGNTVHVRCLSVHASVSKARC